MCRCCFFLRYGTGTGTSTDTSTQEAKRHQQSAAVAQLRELQAQSSALSASVRKLEQDKAQATRGIAQAQKQRAEQDLALEQTEAEIAQIDRKLAAEETRIKQLTAHLVTLHASGRTPQDDAKRTRELEASVTKLKQRCADKEAELHWISTAIGAGHGWLVATETSGR